MDSKLAGATAPIFTEDPYSNEHLVDPYALFERMRDAGPVLKIQEHGVLAVTRFDECKEVLDDYRTFISGAGAGPKNLHHEPSWRAQGIMESDPPIHTQMRQAMAGVISPRGVRSLRAGFEEYATELVDELLERGEFDLIKDLSEVFPLRAFGDAVGIPREGRAENLLTLGAANFSTFGPDTPLAREHFAAGAGTNDWAMANTARERLSPGSLGAQIWDYADRGEITTAQAALLVRAMLSAGLDTTIFSLGSTLLTLVRHPEQYAKVHENPKLVKFAIDEAFRFESPFQSFYRTTSQVTEIGGVAVPEDTKVAVFVGAANRDERRWGPTANEYDITRQAGGHLAFGMGIHQCVGQPLSRLEMDVLITELANRVKSIELTAEPEQFMHTTLRGWKSIPVKVTAA
ncbi:cytochrome P450 [Paeniglutamicibacter sp. NPDC091659]|uniref:cytochrome P450 n=1 Tax=Paeniglutamicibacter sp. NPDC091659 TaxID=3364389 RepID=UPI003805B704